jgi:hypothetical protein
MSGVNRTPDPGRRSRVESAHAAGSAFPIQPLRYGVFTAGGGSRGWASRSAPRSLISAWSSRPS